MNKKQYNNVIENTLKHEQTEDSLSTARAIFNNMGIALPQGDIKAVNETLKSDDGYMSWRPCTMQEAQAAADKGIAAIGVREDKIVVLCANDEEQPVTQSASVMTLDENTSAFAMQGMRYYSYGNNIANNPYILINGWLRLYTSPTITCAGRRVTIPTVSSFIGNDGYTYRFTNKNYWYAYENPYRKDGYINPYVRRALEAKGKRVVVNIGNKGEYTNENGRYWMAVGPKVVNPYFSDNETVEAEKIAGKGLLDVVVKDAYGTKYYIPGVVGDGKEHTWNNGVIQTFKKYPNGAFESAGGNFNGTVAAEFIGSLNDKFSGCGAYTIDSIIFYPDKE